MAVTRNVSVDARTAASREVSSRDEEVFALRRGSTGVKMSDDVLGRRGGEILDQLFAAAHDELLALTRWCELGSEARVRAAAVHVRWILHTLERWAANTAVLDPERHASIAAGLATLRGNAVALIDRAVALTEGRAATRQLHARAHATSLAHLQDTDGRIDAKGRWIEGVTIATDLSVARLDGATLHDVIADHVAADRIDARRTLLIRTSFAAASMCEAVLDECAVDCCSFSRANLERTSWRGATVFDSRFDGAALVDASLDDALFEDCSFQGADFATVHLGERATSAAVKFVRCDLRETNWDRRVLATATFVECKLHGIHGQPRIEGVFVYRPDLSRAGDGSVIGSKREVLDLWCKLS